MTDAALAPNPVILTDRAAKKIGRVLSKQAPGTVLRIVVAGGGCSGFQYEYKLVQETPANDDLVLAKDAATVLIDSLSLEFMGGAEIDYVDDLIGQSFQIKNPNAVAVVRLRHELFGRRLIAKLAAALLSVSPTEEFMELTANARRGDRCRAGEPHRRLRGAGRPGRQSWSMRAPRASPTARQARPIERRHDLPPRLGDQADRRDDGAGMIDLGLLSLDDPVATYLPYFTPQGAGRLDAGHHHPAPAHPHLGHHLRQPRRPTCRAAPTRASRCRSTENLRRLARGTAGLRAGHRVGIRHVDRRARRRARGDQRHPTSKASSRKYVTGPLGMDDTHFFVTDRPAWRVPYGDGHAAAVPHGRAAITIENEPGKPEMFSPSRIFQTDSAAIGRRRHGGHGERLHEAARGAARRLPQAGDRAMRRSPTRSATCPATDAGQKFGLLGAVIDDAAASGWHVAGHCSTGAASGATTGSSSPTSGTSVVVCTNTMREGCNGPFRDEIRDAVFA